MDLRAYLQQEREREADQDARELEGHGEPEVEEPDSPGDENEDAEVIRWYREHPRLPHWSDIVLPDEALADDESTGEEPDSP